MKIFDVVAYFNFLNVVIHTTKLPNVTKIFLKICRCQQNNKKKNVNKNCAINNKTNYRLPRGIS